MNKKIIITSFILLSSIIIPQTNLFAWGGRDTRIGLAAGMFAAEPGSPNIALVFRTGPYDIKFAYDFTQGNQYLFLNGSYMAVNSRPMNHIFSLSLGLGIFGKFYFGDNANNSFGGLNTPISAEITFIDNFLQFFATVAPGLELIPKPRFTTQALCAWIGFTILLDR
ncbi:MAG: hypothetical protein FWC36_00135 [Spirochaetes bacterium]|nr:hypothetical protein [Spirochaetota bacterium]